MQSVAESATQAVLHGVVHGDFGYCAWVQMDLLPELDGGVPLDMPDYISPKAAPAQSPLQWDGQGTHKILKTSGISPYS